MIRQRPSLHSTSIAQFAVSFAFGQLNVLHLSILTTVFCHHLTDALAIYLLNLFLAFLQPKFDPSIQQDIAADDVEEGAPGLPGGGGGGSTRGGLSGLMSGFKPSEEEEFRPFIRRLPGALRCRSEKSL